MGGVMKLSASVPVTLKVHFIETGDAPGANEYVRALVEAAGKLIHVQVDEPDAEQSIPRVTPPVFGAADGVIEIVSGG